MTIEPLHRSTSQLPLARNHSQRHQLAAEFSTPRQAFIAASCSVVWLLRDQIIHGILKQHCPRNVESHCR